MIHIIKKECESDGKKFIYAYDDEPDHTMHELCADSEEVKSLIKNRNNKVEKLCDNLDNTIVFIVADHGHIKVDNIFLNDYIELMNMLERTTSIKQRAVSFKIKQEKIEEFKIKFNEIFGKYFNLYSKEEIIKSKLFGDGDENLLFEDAI